MKDVRALAAKAQLFLGTAKELLRMGDYDLGRALGYAYAKRIVGDYEVGVGVTQDEAKELLESARDFVQALDEYLNKSQEREEEK